MIHLIRAASFAFAVLAAACTTLPPAPSPETAALERRSYAERIEIGGRLSVRYQGARQEEALHGSFAWSQGPDRTTVTLLSPLGQTMAIIDVTAAGATLSQAGQPARSAGSVDVLTADVLGWPLPVGGLRDWLQGFASDGAGRRVAATPEAPEITQDGWRIAYAGWAGDNPVPSRPRRIDLARSTEQAGDVQIRIVIDTWQPN